MGCCEAGPVSGRRGTLWARCHFRMVLARRLAVRDVRFGVKCGVDLNSPGKRGLDCSEERRGVLSSAQGLVEDRVDRWWMQCSVGGGGADMAIRRVGCCDCIRRDRCRWFGGLCGGACDLGWASVIGLWDWGTLLGVEAVNWRLGWWVVVFGSVCEPSWTQYLLALPPMGNRSGRNGMRGR